MKTIHSLPLIYMAAFAIYAALASDTSASVWYVDAAVEIGGDGLSWAEAFKNLPEAVAAAEASLGEDEIRVAGGNYKVFEQIAPPLNLPEASILRGGVPARY